MPPNLAKMLRTLTCLALLFTVGKASAAPARAYTCNGDGVSWTSRVPCPASTRQPEYRCSGNGFAWTSRTPCPGTGREAVSRGGIAPAPTGSADTQTPLVPQREVESDRPPPSDRAPLSVHQCAEIRRVMAARRSPNGGSPDYGDTYRRRCQPG